MTPFLFTEGAGEFLSHAALFLIIGGLAILVLIIALFLVQSLLPLPEGPPVLAAGKGQRRLRPSAGAPPPAPTASRTPPPTIRLWRRRVNDESPVPHIDRALDRFVLEGLGEPRILRRLPGAFHLRLFGCRECVHSPRSMAREGCVVGRARMQEACRQVFGDSARVEEIACRLRGQAACEFEVKA